MDIHSYARKGCLAVAFTVSSLLAGSAQAGTLFTQPSLSHVVGPVVSGFHRYQSVRWHGGWSSGCNRSWGCSYYHGRPAIYHGLAHSGYRVRTRATNRGYGYWPTAYSSGYGSYQCGYGSPYYANTWSVPIAQSYTQLSYSNNVYTAPTYSVVSTSGAGLPSVAYTPGYSTPVYSPSVYSTPTYSYVPSVYSRPTVYSSPVMQPQVYGYSTISAPSYPTFPTYASGVYVDPGMDYGRYRMVYRSPSFGTVRYRGVGVGYTPSCVGGCAGYW